ncbi:PREDICTED: leukocyte elastase inhibitor-like [Diuraphis noxia]|uniref:leukocyte elastase inhibitor-like n=1 Tax=Diuraphis noxia TaxID=143948 RepID=UPI000763689B|nr:PREDICTED: leukocyte elastase inhibitor-like [Diuraphis noxia]
MENSSNIHYTTLTSNYSFTLFKELSSSVEGNVFASTYSIQFLLLLLALGSKSKTNEQLKTVLHLSKDKPPNYENIKAIITKLEVPGHLTVANGIFSDKAFTLSPEYTKNTQKYLNSEVRSVDFSGNPTSGESEVNKWVNSKTNGKISRIFKSGDINKDTALVLASAVHFQNLWKSPFTNTKNASFCLTATKHINIKMLHQTGHFKYFKDDRYKFSANMTVHNVELDVPKFKFESDLNLEKTMQKLGCTEMFSPSADFSELSSSAAGNLRVSSMKHKTYVDVNEDGTEAAAVTGVSIANYNLEYTQSNIKNVKFHACHPFLFIIKKDKDIIFMGRLSDPTA